MEKTVLPGCDTVFFVTIYSRFGRIYKNRTLYIHENICMVGISYME